MHQMLDMHTVIHTMNIAILFGMLVPDVPVVIMQYQYMQYQYMQYQYMQYMVLYSMYVHTYVRTYRTSAATAVQCGCVAV